jgi:starch synthase
MPYRPSTVLAGLATGFQFEGASADSLLATILLALKVYTDQEEWKAIQQTGMGMDYSWECSAKRYVEVYRKLSGER